MSEKFWIAFWLTLALLIAGGTGFAVANGEPWQPFARGVLFAWTIQQLGLHVRASVGLVEGTQGGDDG